MYKPNMNTKATDHFRHTFRPDSYTPGPADKWPYVTQDQSYAPCCYMIQRPDMDPSQSILIQTDWDWPGIASALGWVPCDCGETDGTVDCPHRTAADMIQEAGEYIDAHLDEPCEALGEYFID